MLSFSAPWWFSALFAVPLVWWLHRYRERGQVFLVAALFLWSPTQTTGRVGPHAGTPEPIWWLRAALVCLLVLALCEPRYSTDTNADLTVWIDDSFSMFSRDEQGITRMQHALSELQSQLANREYRSITLRSLGNPGRSGEIGARHLQSLEQPFKVWIDQPGGEPMPPNPALMRTDSEHWLLSDGASAGLATWARQAPLSRLVSVGGSSENAGISEMVVSNNGRSPNSRQLLVSVSNGGTTLARRRLEIYRENTLDSSVELELDPGREEQRVFALEEHSVAPIRALLRPADALPLDDALALSTAELQPLMVRASPACGRNLRAALAAHPVLSFAAESINEPVTEHSAEAALYVHCEADGAINKGPAIIARIGPDFTPVGAELFWSADSGALRELILSPGSLRALAASVLPPAGVRLLTAGGAALITHDPQRQIIDVRLDLAHSPLVRLPEYPLLVSALVDRVLARNAMPGVVAARRNHMPSVIAPQALFIQPQARRGPAVSVAKDLSVYLIGAVLALLCLDLMLLVWRQLQQSQRLKDWRAPHAR